MNDMRLPLPKDTRAFFDENKAKILASSNFGLLFNKFIYLWSEEWTLEEKEKKGFLKEISNGTLMYFKSVAKLIDSSISRQEAFSQGIRDHGWHTAVFTMKTHSRLILGLGGASALETGLILHPLYGFPYLPASSIKGIARAYARMDGHASPEEIKCSFGSEDKEPQAIMNNIQGGVIFLDGFPKAFPKLIVDIMNPHYSEYYQGEKPPADYLNPSPIYFLAIEKGAQFSFSLVAKEEALLSKVAQWLKKGLIELGIGGKTNVGYGYFEECQSEEMDREKTVTDPKDILMENFLSQARQCKGPGDKSILVKIFEAAKAMDIQRRQTLLEKVKESLPPAMKKNEKIKEFLNNQERELR